MKRSDITTDMLLAEIAAGPCWWERMCENWPPKLVRAAAERERSRAQPTIEYGVCVERSWLTRHGRQHLKGAQL